MNEEMVIKDHAFSSSDINIAMAVVNSNIRANPPEFFGNTLNHYL